MKLRILAVSALALAMSGCKLSSSADSISAPAAGDILDVTQASVSTLLNTLGTNSSSPRAQVFICLDQLLSGNDQQAGVLEGLDVTVTSLTNGLSLVVGPNVDPSAIDLQLQPLITGLQGSLNTLPVLLQTLLTGQATDANGDPVACTSYEKTTGTEGPQAPTETADNPVTGPIFRLLDSLLPLNVTGEQLPAGQIGNLGSTLNNVTGTVTGTVTGLLSGNPSATTTLTNSVTQSVGAVTGALTGNSGTGTAPVTGLLSSLTSGLSTSSLNADGLPLNAGLLEGLLSTITGLLTGLTSSAPELPQP